MQRVKNGTRKIRYSLVWVLSPSLYHLASQTGRPMIQYAKSVFGKHPLVGAEIGCGLCYHAKSILQTLNCSALYLVDPYTLYVDDNRKVETMYLDGVKEMKKLTQKNKNAVFIQKTSLEAVDKMGQLDFCYIDANHTFKHVVEDIICYYPKVKNGGIIGGHYFDAEHKEVCEAVLYFAKANNVEIHGTGNNL